MAPPPVARDKLAEFGIDEVCAQIVSGASMTAIAAKIGVSFGSLSAWLDADPERSARARDARRSTAKLWDETAAQTILDAKDPFELARAKELAFHYRWRSSKIAPAEYGDKVAVEHTGEMALRSVPDERLRLELAGLLQIATGYGDCARIGQESGEAED